MCDGNTSWVCNVKAVSFVHLFASFAIEYNLFREDQQGGLLIEDDHGDNALEYLVISSNGSYDEDHHLLADNTFLASLVRLRQSDKR